MKFNHGLANIPLILGIVLLVFAVPVAVLLVQQNQNTQNRAYEDTSTGSVGCTQVLNAKVNYCSGSTISNVAGVPCSEINSAVTQYCIDIPTRTPMGTPVPVITSTPKPTSTSSIRCTTGQAKCAGRILFKCTKNQWYLQQICPISCTNGTCINKPPIIIKPPIKPVVR